MCFDRLNKPPMRNKNAAGKTNDMSERRDNRELYLENKIAREQRGDREPKENAANHHNQ